jgi:hypothetical protein
MLLGIFTLIVHVGLVCDVRLLEASSVREISLQESGYEWS